MNETLIQMLESECISMVLSEYYHTKIGRMHVMKHKATALAAENAELKAKLEAMELALKEISELSYGQGHAAVSMAADAIGKKLPDVGSLAAV